MRRRWVSLGLVPLCVALTSTACGDEDSDTTAPSPPVATTVVTWPGPAAADVTVATADLMDIVTRHVNAWNAKDGDALRMFWDENTLFWDTGNFDELSGERLLTMPERMFENYPDHSSTLQGVFVASGVALVLLDTWGVPFMGVQYTVDDPFRELNRMELGPDGRFDSWTAYYAIEMYERGKAPGSLLAAARSLQDQYLAAWNSGEPAEVEAIYSPDARRDDALFDSDLTGAEEIGSYAADFFRWYPGAVFGPTVRVTDNRATTNDPDTVGLVFSIDHTETGGSDCAVEGAAILQARDGLIINEELFWDAESLISCGWAT